MGPLSRFTQEQLPGFELALAQSIRVPEGIAPVVVEALNRSLGVGGAAGSRWRPLLTLAAAQAFGNRDPEGALKAALAVEFTHTASLILDDLPCMDDASERRGQATTHLQVGTGGAILLALALLGRSAELLGKVEGVGGLLAAAWGEAFGLDGMSGGQAVDLTGAFARGGSPRRLHRKKTTSLSAFAMEAGARCGGASEAGLQAAIRFGRDLGWAYQLADDAEDWKEDGRLGRGPAGRSPRAQSERLLGRALRHLDTASGIDPEGRDLLSGLARRAAGFPSGAGMPHWG